MTSSGDHRPPAYDPKQRLDKICLVIQTFVDSAGLGLAWLTYLYITSR